VASLERGEEKVGRKEKARRPQVGCWWLLAGGDGERKKVAVGEKRGKEKIG